MNSGTPSLWRSSNLGQYYYGTSCRARRVARRSPAEKGLRTIRLPLMAIRRIIHMLVVTAFLEPICAAAPIFARNVDLSTVPKRDSVQLTITAERICLG
jgi:hypothetical protein